MAYSRARFTVVTNGQNLLVSVTVGGTAITFYTDAALTSSVSAPANISTDTTYYVPDDGYGPYAVSVKQADGTELYGVGLTKQQLLNGVTVTPLPSRVQLAADAVTAIPTTYGGAFRSGYYYFTSPGQLSSVAPTAGFSYAQPWIVPATVSIAKMGCEVTSAGGSGSVVRIGVWSDTGAGYPNALLLDAGTIDGTSVTVQDITLGSALILGPGLYWVSTACQVGTTATLRTSLQGASGICYPLGTSKPSAGTTIGGHYMAHAGALTGPWTGTPNPINVNHTARVHFQVS